MLDLMGYQKQKTKHGKKPKQKKVFVWWTRYHWRTLYTELAHRVARNKNNKEASDNLAKPRTITAKLLDYKKKEEIMKLVFKLKDTGFYIRNYYSKETISIKKKVMAGREKFTKICSVQIR